MGCVSELVLGLGACILAKNKFGVGVGHEIRDRSADFVAEVHYDSPRDGDLGGDGWRGSTTW